MMEFSKYMDLTDENDETKLRNPDYQSLFSPDIMTSIGIRYYD